jgi:hypothetical protein
MAFAKVIPQMSVNKTILPDLLLKQQLNNCLMASKEKAGTEKSVPASF